MQYIAIIAMTIAAAPIFGMIGLVLLVISAIAIPIIAAGLTIMALLYIAEMIYTRSRK